MRNKKYLMGLLLALCAAAPGLFAQTWKPGVLMRPASTSTTLHSSYFSTAISSQQVLDPNGDSYVSATSAGFPANDDVTGSEVNYKPIMPYSVEPYGDLRRGPSHGYSDFVPGIDNASYYMYYRATAGSEALLFRMRLGSIVPGAKGYSILLDTDGKFGASGPNADPNYVAATTGTNGNAGFELEVNLFTQTSGQTGIAVYNVDGTSSPVLLWSANNWQDYSQTALASTSDNGDPDFFLDFFVPFSKLGITASTPLRAVATTVMAPLPAIGGPKSDIYGLADGAYGDPNAQYEAFINAQPQFTASTLGGAGTASLTAQMCTAAPVVNDITTTGTIAVSGTWTKSSLSTVGSATITLYKIKNGVTSTLGTTPAAVASGITWSIPNITVAAGDTIYAKALGTPGESQCLSSNYVRVRGCTTPTPTTGLNFTCIGTRGMTGTMAAANQVVKLYTMTVNGPVLYATDGTTPSPSGYLITYSATTPLTFDYNGANNGGQQGACSGGNPDMPSNASFFYTVTSPGQCESAPILAVASTASSGQNTPCLGGTPTAVPTITQSVLYNTSSSLSGTAANSALVLLYQNGTLLGTTATSATSTAYSFSNLALSVNDKIEVYAYASASNCVSATPALRTVATCVTPAPVINTTSSGLLSIGQPITGTAAAGSTVRLYNAANTLLATTIAQSNGTWTTSGATFSNGFTGTAAASTSYYATSTSGSCTASAASATASTGSGITPANRCGTITANVPSGSLTSATTSVTVAYANATNLKVTLYEDGVAVASQSGLAGSSTVIFDVSNKLYAGNGSTTGILTIGVQESGQEETTCSATYPVQPNCTAPAAPTVSPSNTLTVSPGQTVTYTVQSPTASTFYSISDGSTGAELATGVWASSTNDFSMTTRPVTSTTSALVKAVVMTASGEVCTSSATLVTMKVLPVTLLYFKGVRNGTENVLNWQAAEELNSSHYVVERSADGASFRPVGQVAAQGSGVAYSFTDRQPGQGTSYYRLRMVDIDSRFSYSQVVGLKATASGSLLAEVTPNPFTASLRLQVQLPAAGAVDVRLLDGVGRTVRTLRAKGVQGTNIFHLTGLNGLQAGVYVVTMRSGNDTYSVRVFKGDK